MHESRKLRRLVRAIRDLEGATTSADLRGLGSNASFARVYLSLHPVEAQLISRCHELKLTARETEVMSEAFKGKTDKEISQALGNRPRTVSQQLLNIYHKLGVRTRGEAIRRLLDPPRHGCPGNGVDGAGAGQDKVAATITILLYSAAA